METLAKVESVVNRWSLSKLRRESLRKGVPAFAVALAAFSFAAYGKWILPKQLPQTYEERLTEFQQRYDELPKNSEESIRIGSSIAICYDRLERMGVEIEPWEKLEFYDKHLRRLTDLSLGENQGEVSNDSEDAQEDLEKQIADFQDRQLRLTERLASENSGYGRLANLKIARNLLDGDFSIARADQTISTLDKLLTESPDSTESADLRLVLDMLRYESAWQKALATSTMPPDFSNLSSQTHDVNLESNTVSEVAVSADSMRSATFELRNLERQLILSEKPSATASELIDSVESSRTLESRFEEYLLAHACQGDWAKVRGLLGQRFALANKAEQTEMRTRLSSSFLRLFFSPLAKQDSAWVTASPAGLQLAMELNPAATEINSLLWELAIQHAQLDEKRDAITDELVEAILISDSSQRYAILALSNALRDALDPAQNYLDFAVKQDPNTIARIGSIALWQASVLPPESEIPVERLAELLDDNQDRDQSTYASLALARIQIRTGELDAASLTLDAIEQKSGETPPILAMRRLVLDAISSVEATAKP